MDKLIYDAVQAKLDDLSPIKRIKIELLIEAAIPLNNGMDSDFAFPKRLLRILKELEKDAKISFPSPNGKGWSRPDKLPSFVKALRPEVDELNRKNQKIIENLRNKTPWEPIRMIKFALNLSKREELELAVIVNDYLLLRKADEEKLPHRERALRIFGDEKALDRYVRTGLFKGQITLDDLDCFYCPEPLPFEPLSQGTFWSPESFGASDAPGLSAIPNQQNKLKSSDTLKTSGKPLLIVENSNTYRSCCRANHILGRFAAVVYGKGSSITNQDQAVYGLQAIEKQLESEGIWYFGDLDPTGLWIPEEINRHRKKFIHHQEKEELFELEPAIPLYRALIKNNLTTPYTPPGKWPHSPDFPIKWLGQEIASPYLDRRSTCRWPQEGLTARDIIDAMNCELP